MSNIFGNDGDGNGGGGGGPSDYDVAQDIIIQAVEDSVPSMVNLNPILARLDNLELADVRIDLDVLGLETSKLSIVDHDVYKASIVVDQNVQNSRLLGLENEQVIQNGLIAANTSLANNKVSTSTFNSQVSALNGVDSSLQTQITTEKNKNDVQDIRLSSVESINTIQSTAITNLQTSINGININGKLDTALYNVDQVARANIQSTNNNRLTSLEMADTSTAAAINGINNNINNLVIADNSLDSRIDVLEARPFPLTASLVPSNTIVGVAGNDVQTNIISLKNLIDGISVSSSGFSLPITTLVNNMDVRFGASTKLTELSSSGVNNGQAKAWSHVAQLDQNLNSSFINGASFRRLALFADPAGAFAFIIKGGVVGDSDVFRVNSSGMLSSIGRDVVSGPLIDNYNISRSGLLLKNTASLSTFEGNQIGINTLIDESKRFTTFVNQALNTTSNVNFATIQSGSFTVNDGLVMEDTRSERSYIKCKKQDNSEGINITNTGRMILYKSNVRSAEINENNLFLYLNPFNTNLPTIEIGSDGVIIRKTDASLEFSHWHRANGSYQAFGTTRVNPNLPSFSCDTTGNVSCHNITCNNIISPTLDAIVADLNYKVPNYSINLTNTTLPNSIGSLTGCNVLGVNNDIVIAHNCNIIGNTNLFNSVNRQPDFVNLIGWENYVSGINSIVNGFNNNAIGGNNYIFGWNNNASNEDPLNRGNLIFGNNNNVIDGSNNNIIGSGNTTLNSGNYYIIGGNWNNGDKYTNTSNNPFQNNILLGDATIGGPRASMIVGNGLRLNTSGDTLPVSMVMVRDATSAQHSLVLSTSSRRYKENIEDFDYDVQQFAKIKVRKYNRIGNKRDEVGLIAEEMAELGYGEYVCRNEEGECEGLNYDKMVCMLISVVQKQQRQIDSLLAYFKNYE